MSTRCVVATWTGTWGFADADNGKTVYIHKAVINDQALKVGGAVYADLVEVEGHGGRVKGVNVSGPGICSPSDAQIVQRGRKGVADKGGKGASGFGRGGKKGGKGSEGAVGGKGRGTPYGGGKKGQDGYGGGPTPSEAYQPYGHAEDAYRPISSGRGAPVRQQKGWDAKGSKGTKGSKGGKGGAKGVKGGNNFGKGAEGGKKGVKGKGRGDGPIASWYSAAIAPAAATPVPRQAPAHAPQVRSTVAVPATAAPQQPKAAQPATASEPELRIDSTDGNAYTKEDFHIQYGGLVEWAMAVVYRPAAAAAPAAAPAADEVRVDPADGNTYTRAQFIDCYGGTREWDAAQPKL